MEFADRQDFLHGLIYILFKRRWLVVCCAFAAFATVLFAGFLITPTWDAEAYIRVEERGNTRKVPFAEVAVPTSTPPVSPAENVALILTGKRMARDIVQEFHLDERLRQRAQNPERLRDRAKMLVVKTLQSPILVLQLLGIVPKPEIDWVDKAAEDFRKGLTAWLDVEVVEGTDIVEIKVSGESQELAMNIANSLAKRIQAVMAEIAVRSNEETALAYRHQLDEAELQLVAAEEALSAFLEENHMGTPSETTRMVASELNALRIESEKLKSEIRVLEAERDALAVREPPGAIPASERIEANPVIDALRQQLNARLVRYAAERPDKTNLHPDILVLRSEIDELSARLDRELANILQGLQLDLNRLEHEIGALESQLIGLPAKEFQYTRLLLDVQTYQQLIQDLESFTAQLDAISASGSADTMVRIVERAHVSPLADNDSPSLPIVLFVALVLAIGAGLGPAFFIEYWRDPIKGPRDLERNDVRVLGTVPPAAALRKERGI